jgi:hypothetical protein
MKPLLIIYSSFHHTDEDKSSMNLRSLIHELTKLSLGFVTYRILFYMTLIMGTIAAIQGNSEIFIDTYTIFHDICYSDAIIESIYRLSDIYSLLEFYNEISKLFDFLGTMICFIILCLSCDKIFKGFEEMYLRNP